MPPDLALGRRPGLGARLSPAWRGTLVRIALAWLALIGVFAPDWARIADQWWNSSTYNHMVLVPPLVAWLAWQRREQVMAFAPATWLPGLVAFGALLFVWALGALSGFDLLRQAAVVGLLPASLLSLAGPRVFAALMFPLAYMVFMVPFGDELVPVLQMITAKLTVALVNLSAIPAAIDGVYIDTPAGLFEVAEACSGVKFLIAMVALGVFVAHVGFSSWRRRAAFMVLCIVAPIVGNGLRAFATIFMAQYVGAERAAGIDHLIYGWVFFATIIALVIGLAWRHFDRAVDDPMVDVEAVERSPLISRLARASASAASGTIGLVLLVAVAIGWVALADGRSATLPARIALLEVPGWQRVDYAPAYPWEPRAAGAEHRLLGRYADAHGHRVDVFYALYSVQREGQEAGGFGEGALRAESGWSWLGAGPAQDQARADRLRADNGTERLALTFYRTGDLLSGNNLALKLAVLRDRALLRRRPTALLILSSEAGEQGSPATGLAEFQRAAGAVGPWMDRIASAR
ncbi:exosortase A [Novosphingobium kunmingense]|uniref:Exosortase A n=1 Tax=Novosphingobium kunmingense TaxID=1211806 RepID=A0A2N0I350_9SPHN|nr:exosortase A [Novosphingobium kunmingense]PKB25591.1 exosortase A [Novosphingobium kunmingense]